MLRERVGGKWKALEGAQTGADLAKGMGSVVVKMASEEREKWVENALSRVRKVCKMSTRVIRCTFNTVLYTAPGVVSQETLDRLNI